MRHKNRRLNKQPGGGALSLGVFMSGLSTSKPTTAGVGTTFMATDTHQIFIFDGTNWNLFGG